MKANDASATADAMPELRPMEEQWNTVFTTMQEKMTEWVAHQERLRGCDHQKYSAEALQQFAEYIRTKEGGEKVALMLATFMTYAAAKH
jgi:hypothetical protein